MSIHKACIFSSPMFQSSDDTSYMPVGACNRFTGLVSNFSLDMSHQMGKPTICLSENKGADQLRSNYMDGAIPLLSKFKISSL